MSLSVLLSRRCSSLPPPSIFSTPLSPLPLLTRLPLSRTPFQLVPQYRSICFINPSSPLLTLILPSSKSRHLHPILHTSPYTATISTVPEPLIPIQLPSILNVLQFRVLITYSAPPPESQALLNEKGSYKISVFPIIHSPFPAQS